MMKTIRTEPTFNILTKKIKEGKDFQFNLFNQIEELGFQESIKKIYAVALDHMTQEEVNISFLTKELGLTVSEAQLLLCKLNPEVSSYIYKKMFQGTRLVMTDEQCASFSIPNDTKDISNLYVLFGV